MYPLLYLLFITHKKLRFHHLLHQIPSTLIYVFQACVEHETWRGEDFVFLVNSHSAVGCLDMFAAHLLYFFCLLALATAHRDAYITKHFSNHQRSDAHGSNRLALGVNYFVLITATVYQSLQS